MDSMDLAKSTVFLHLKPARIILFVLIGCIVATLTIRASHRYTHTHGFPPPKEKKPLTSYFEDNLKQFIIITLACQ